MAPYHILIVIISSVIPENLVLLTKSEQSGPKSAHIRPTIRSYSRIWRLLHFFCAQQPPAYNCHSIVNAEPFTIC